MHLTRVAKLYLLDWADLVDWLVNADAQYFDLTETRQIDCEKMEHLGVNWYDSSSS